MPIKENPTWPSGTKDEKTYKNNIDCYQNFQTQYTHRKAAEQHCQDTDTHKKNGNQEQYNLSKNQSLGKVLNVHNSGTSVHM